jgi:hypothetical protein
LITLQLFGIGVTQLLVGGAFATVLVGIAAQQSLSNVFATRMVPHRQAADRRNPPAPRTAGEQIDRVWLVVEDVYEFGPAELGVRWSCW